MKNNKPIIRGELIFSLIFILSLVFLYIFAHNLANNTVIQHSNYELVIYDKQERMDRRCRYTAGITGMHTLNDSRTTYFTFYESCHNHQIGNRFFIISKE